MQCIEWHKTPKKGVAIAPPVVVINNFVHKKMSGKENNIILNGENHHQRPADKESIQSAVESRIFQLHSDWKKTAKTRDEVRSEQERILWSRANHSLRHLVEGSLPKDEETDVLKKMVDLCILLSGLGSSTAQPVVKETYPALLSVMKTGDVARFVDLPPGDRKEHLLELAQIVMGIRLFNKDCRKGGAGIDDLPNVLSRAAKTASYRLDEGLSAVRTRCSLYTATLSKVYYLHSSETEMELKAFIPQQFSETDVEIVKTALCFCRLHHRCLSEVYCELRDAELHVRTCVEQLRSTLLQLHETVRYRSAIPTIQVYPLFVQLSLIWRELQYKTASLSHINQLVDALTLISKEVEEPAMVRFFKRSLVAESASPITTDRGTKVKLKGFCPWSLIQTSGALVPGTCVMEGYAFRTATAADCWLRDTVCARSALQTVLASRPYLLLFLGLPWGSREDSPVAEDEQKMTETKECAIQTEVHPVPSHIDKDYSWSVWEMKRRALQLARLVNCKTTSQQTDADMTEAGKMSFRAILDSSYSSEVGTTTVHIARISSVKNISKVVKILGEKMPIPHLQHLKRVKRQEGEFLVVLDRVERQTKRPRMDDDGLSEFVSDFREVEVPRDPPRTRAQFMQCNKLWPVNFHPEQRVERLLEEKMFDANEFAWHRQCMRKVLEDAEAGKKNVALVGDPVKQRVVANSSSALDSHPLGHAVMNAIEDVARLQREGAKEPSDYLCTGWDLYVAQEPCPMCAMALVHSRASRVFFGKRDDKVGALISCCQVQFLKDLNHHYQVFEAYENEDGDEN